MKTKACYSCGKKMEKSSTPVTTSGWQSGNLSELDLPCRACATDEDVEKAKENLNFR